MRHYLMAACLLAAAVLAATPDEQRRRAEALEARLLAPCCYQEPVARHQSETAVKMRLEIERLVAAGQSDEQILGIYTQRYGQRVLADTTPAPAWAQWVPWGLALAAALALSCWLARSAGFSLPFRPR